KMKMNKRSLHTCFVLFSNLVCYDKRMTTRINNDERADFSTLCTIANDDEQQSSEENYEFRLSISDNEKRNNNIVAVIDPACNKYKASYPTAGCTSSQQIDIN